MPSTDGAEPTPPGPALPGSGPADPTDPTDPTDVADLADLTAEVSLLEVLPRADPGAAQTRAQAAVRTARAAGWTELERRAELVLADVAERSGDVAGAARLAQDVHRWATEQSSRYVLARAAYVLTGVFTDLGDTALALEHAVRSVDLLGDQGSLPLRIDHLMRLADAISVDGDEPTARSRYPDVLRLADDVGDVERQLLVLNNWSYGEVLAGEYAEALRLCEQLIARADLHGVPLHIGRLDTVARALMGMGRYDEAEQALLPGLTPEMLARAHDGDALATGLLTLAEAQRCAGRPAEAVQTLARCLQVAADSGLTGVHVRALEEQAQLHAACGEHQLAYEVHREFHARTMELRSDQREARARTLQTIYETSEARRQSRQYRELSLRDPLTRLYNRRFVDEELPRLLAGDAGSHRSVTVALLDLDHFKRINDTCSHEVGDQVLQAVARMLDTATADAFGSFAARMGGEEFLAVLVAPDGDPRAGIDRLEDLRRAISWHPWAALTGALPVTVSIGSTLSDESSTMTALLSVADAHLYAAKRQGRDQVVADEVLTG